ADTQRAQIACHRQTHSSDTGLGSGIGDLTYLAFEGGDGGRVDDDTTLFILGLIANHVRRGEPADVERCDQIEVDDLTKLIEAVRSVFAQGSLAYAAT